MKARLLAGAVTIAAPLPEPDRSTVFDIQAEPEIVPHPKPIATIGKMQKSATKEQRALHGRMKRDMKKAARNIRYQHLQEQKARDKP